MRIEDKIRKRLELELSRVGHAIEILKKEPRAEELEGLGDNTPLSEEVDAMVAVEDGELRSALLSKYLDRAAALEILGEGAAGSRLLKSKLPKMFNRDFAPQFQLELMEKDLRYFLALAGELDRPTPIAALVRSQYQAGRRAQLGKLDTCAVFLQAAGEPPPHQG